MILAPGINVKRIPACGRNFEYFSEDPYLIGELAVPLIEGIEESDVSACVKHFALNQQEEERLWVNVEVDERTLREIYLPGYEIPKKEESEHNWQEDSLKGKEEAFCTVSVKVKNTGTMAGMETVQLYLGEKEVRAENPVKELKAFEKVALEPGESKEVRFILDQSAFAHYDGNEGRFVTKAGTYTLYLGTSSQNILAERNVEI